MRCPTCGDPVEARFNLCPTCGHSLRQETAPAPPGTAREILSEASGIDRGVLGTIGALLRRPGEVAAAATRVGPSRYTRPFRLFFVISSLAFAFYGLRERVTAPTAQELAAIPPTELSMSFGLEGPEMTVGSEILAQIEAAGGPDAWLEETGRLESLPPVMRVLARRGLRLEYQQRIEAASTAFSENRALIALLGIPVLALVLAVLFPRGATPSGHLNLAAVLFSGLLLIDLARIALARTISAVVPGSPALLIAMTALHLAFVLAWSGLALRGFYRPGIGRLIASTPVVMVGAVVAYALGAMLLSAAFLITG